MRVASLIASSTEIVCALGSGAELVARSHECDYPESVKALPALTRPQFPDGSSAEIDRRVKGLVSDGLSVYHVDAERLAGLRPDLILTQSQCEVCAVSLADVERAVRGWAGGSVRVVSLSPGSLEGVWEDIRAVAAALGRPEAGADLVARLKARMAGIARRAAVLKPVRVAVLEWLDPLMAAGNWTPELVAMAGGANLFGETGRHSGRMRFSELAAADPDAIVLTPCGFSLERALAEAPALTGLPGWAELRAAREGRVIATDGNQFFNRPGPRLAETLEILAEALHPEEFRFGHEGVGWSRL